MAKIDIANEIVAEFPDKGFEAEKLKDDNTEAELLKLQEDLRAEADSSNSDSESEEQESKEVDSTKKYRLKDPSTQYGEGSFSLSGDQEKELPKNPSIELLGRIRSGFIVEVK